uniref:Tryptophan synthase alpha chain n=1 Tax=Rhodochaete parvula TaxID=110510 RepID=A0A1X9PUP6_9RHOD|nr:tryptophan synthase alpha subunit [Rhodochaete parvula]ASK39689.1 tryptophan synthase alpha subunit [Rhodochaete parvula]
MSETISSIFRSLRIHNQCALVPFITVGDPDLETTEKIVNILDNEGANIIELGIPYSDSLADGPVIQEAAARALRHGTKFTEIIKLITKIAPRISSAIVLFTYYNLILSQECKLFVSRIALAGVKGLIVPDLPIEEADELLSLCNRYNVELILLISPTSSVARIKKITEKAQGCIYIVASTGVTGIRPNLALEVQGLINKVKEFTVKPLIVGFGISTPTHVSLVKSWGVDGVVLGSAFVKKISSCDKDNMLIYIRKFCQQIKQATQ